MEFIGIRPHFFSRISGPSRNGNCPMSGMGQLESQPTHSEQRLPGPDLA